jgi:hypothetical protein
MATACFRLRTFLPLRPLVSWPRFILCIARSTDFPAFRPYLLAIRVTSEPPGGGCCEITSRFDIGYLCKGRAGDMSRASQ